MAGKKSILERIGLGDLLMFEKRERRTFWFLVLITIFLYADQNLVSPNISHIGMEFGFYESESMQIILTDPFIIDEMRSKDILSNVQEELEKEYPDSEFVQDKSLISLEESLASITDYNNLLSENEDEIFSMLAKSDVFRAFLSSDKYNLKVLSDKWGADSDRMETLFTSSEFNDRLEQSLSEDDFDTIKDISTSQKLENPKVQSFLEHQGLLLFATDKRNIDDKVAGLMWLLFFTFGGAVSIAIGYLTDKTARKKLLLWCVVIGELPCLLTYFAPDLTWFLILRALSGIGMGGVFPLTYSLLGDFFTVKNRSIAAGWLGLALGLGIGIGQILAGNLYSVAGWRLPFLIVSVPNIVIAFFFAFFAVEPGRGKSEIGMQKVLGDDIKNMDYKERIKIRDLKKIFSIKTNVLLFAQSIPGTVPWGLLMGYLFDFYAHEKGFGVGGATNFMTIIGLGALLGGFVGGIIGNYLHNKNSKFLPLLCGATTTIGVIPFLYIVNFTPESAVPTGQEMVILFIVGFLGYIIIPITGANVKAVITDVNVPENRGTIFSFFNLTDDIGKGLGMFLLGFLAGTYGRIIAFNIAVLLWIFCGLVWFVIMFVFPKDEKKLDELMEKRAREYTKSAQ